jgi:hypothetical protein
VHRLDRDPQRPSRALRTVTATRNAAKPLKIKAPATKAVSDQPPRLIAGSR